MASLHFFVPIPFFLYSMWQVHYMIFHTIIHCHWTNAWFLIALERWEKQLLQLCCKTPKSVIHPQYSICRGALMLWGKRGRETERMRSRSSLSKTNESCMSRQQQDDCSTWRSHPDETEEMRRVTFHWSWHWHIFWWN